MVHSDCGYNSLNTLEQLADSDLLIRESQDWTSIIFNGWFVNLVQMYHTIIHLRYHLKSIQLLYIISVLAENRGGLAKPKTEKTEPKNTEPTLKKPNWTEWIWFGFGLSKPNLTKIDRTYKMMSLMQKIFTKHWSRAIDLKFHFISFKWITTTSMQLHHFQWLLICNNQLHNYVVWKSWNAIKRMQELDHKFDKANPQRKIKKYQWREQEQRNVSRIRGKKTIFYPRHAVINCQHRVCTPTRAVQIHLKWYKDRVTIYEINFFSFKDWNIETLAMVNIKVWAHQNICFLINSSQSHKLGYDSLSHQRVDRLPNEDYTISE